MPFKSKTQPLCRYCGKKIAKFGTTVYINSGMSQGRFYRSIKCDPAEHPSNKEECKRFTNQEVISISRARNRDGKVDWFVEWDGESYKDGVFCNQNHAVEFAYGMAKTFPTYGGSGWREAVDKTESQ